MGEVARIAVPVIVGATAVGKTAVCMRLARDLRGEVISCDSRQIYRGMDIGTAKPAPELRGEVCHWLVDIRDPDEAYNAWRFSVDAARATRDAASRGVPALLCGGTGLYLKCLMEGMGTHGPSDETMLALYRAKAQQEGPDSIFRELERVDAETASRLHPHDTQRVIRALHVFHETGVPLSVHNKRTCPSPDFEFLILVLYRERSILYERIDSRVGAMMEAGLWNEFLALRRRGYGEDSPGMKCLGYRELFDVERGSLSLGEAADRIRRGTRRFAKRQMTWFAHQVSGTTVDASDEECYARIVRSVAAFLEGGPRQCDPPCRDR